MDGTEISEAVGISPKKASAAGCIGPTGLLRAGVVLALCALAGAALAQDPPTPSTFTPSPVSGRVHAYLVEGNAQPGLAQLSTELEAKPEGVDLRFATGIMQVIAGVEKLGQSWYVTMNPKQENWFGGGVPFIRLPIPVNPSPEVATHADVRAAMGSLLRDLEAAEATLAPLEGREVKFELDLTGAHFDFDGDLKASPEEEILAVFNRMSRGMGAAAPDAPSPELRVRLDTGDVLWLRGYCHLLSGMLESYLAYDDSTLFANLGHRIFHVPGSPFASIGAKGQYDDFADAILAIHLIKLPLSDPTGPPRALAHFKETVRLSRAEWVAYSAETDNDLEWIPNPQQTSVLGGAKVTPEMVAQWGKVLDQLDAVLGGRALVPHWQLRDGRGVNLKRAFMEPREFDLVGWVHGNATVPYLEQGTMVDTDFWNGLNRSFGGRFLPFAFWFN